MHAGNIFSSLMQWLIVRAQNGRIVLRIDDLDRERSKPELADLILKDYEMLGLTWDEGPVYQQEREEAYKEALDTLRDKDLIYPCFCTRADLHAASAPHRGDKVVYPGTCKGLSPDEVAFRSKVRKPALRIKVPDRYYGSYDLIQGHYGQNLEYECGDFIVRRSDGLFAYQLACVVDDAYQGVNCIVRGVDLISSMPQQRFLQEALGLSPVQYAHIPLLVSRLHRRLSKRDHDASLDELLSTYHTPAGVLGHIAYIGKLQPYDEPATPDDLLAQFNLETVSELFEDPIQILWRS